MNEARYVYLAPSPYQGLFKKLLPFLILGAIIFAIYQYRNYCYQYELYKKNMEQMLEQQTQEQQPQTVIKK